MTDGHTRSGQPESPALPGVTRWRQKPAVIEAHQWHKNGDHPADNCRMITPDQDSTTQFAPFLSEGEIVRYYRNPDDDGQRECGDCGRLMHDHGWIDQGALGRIVCPGDWVVSLLLSTPGLIAYFPVAADVFAAAYEPAGEPLVMPAGELAALRRSARILANIVARNHQVMEAARIEMLQNGPHQGMQWILNSIPDVWDDPETEWDGKESAQAWFDRTEAFYRAAEAAAPAIPSPPVAADLDRDGDACPIEAVFPDGRVPCVLPRNHDQPHSFGDTLLPFADEEPAP